jgi:hypothetical protein
MKAETMVPQLFRNARLKDEVGQGSELYPQWVKIVQKQTIAEVT